MSEGRQGICSECFEFVILGNADVIHYQSVSEVQFTGADGRFHRIYSGLNRAGHTVKDWPSPRNYSQSEDKTEELDEKEND